MKISNIIFSSLFIFFINTSTSVASIFPDCEGSPVTVTEETLSKTTERWNLCVGHLALSSEDEPDKFYYIFKGNFKNGERNGQGTLLIANGDKYEGNFKNGKYHGEGTFFFKDGHKYVGLFKEGGYEGLGQLTFADGTKYKGNFKNGKYHGQK